MTARRVLLGVMLAIAGGCSKGTYVPPDPDAADDGLPPGTTDIDGIVAKTNFAPIKDVLICVAESPAVGCVLTGDLGMYELAGLPDDAHLHVTYEKDGYFTARWSFPSGEAETNWGVGLFETSEMDPWAEQGGEPFRKTEGVVTFKAVDAKINGIPGVTATLAADAFVGPLYLDGREPSAANETDDSGVGMFYAVAPGTYDLVYHPPTGMTCVPRWGWSGTVEGSVEVEVVADASTYVEMLCE